MPVEETSWDSAWIRPLSEHVSQDRVSPQPLLMSDPFGTPEWESLICMSQHGHSVVHPPYRACFGVQELLCSDIFPADIQTCL